MRDSRYWVLRDGRHFAKGDGARVFIQRYQISKGSSDVDAYAGSHSISFQLSAVSVQPNEPDLIWSAQAMLAL
jgi:hypothetical protein